VNGKELLRTLNITQDGTEFFLRLTPDAAVSIPEAGGITDVAIETNLTDWSYTQPAGSEWLTVTTTAAKISFAAAANTLQTGTRSAVVTLISPLHPNYTKTINVSQTSSYVDVSVELTVSEGDKNQQFTGLGGNSTVNVTANVTYTAVSNQPTWCAASLVSGGIKIEVSENASEGAARSATVTISALGAPDITINVAQAKGPFIFPISLNLGDASKVFINWDDATNPSWAAHMPFYGVYARLAPRYEDAWVWFNEFDLDRSDAPFLRFQYQSEALNDKIGFIIDPTVAWLEYFTLEVTEGNEWKTFEAPLGEHWIAQNTANLGGTHRHKIRLNLGLYDDNIWFNIKYAGMELVFPEGN
jgi:hypothetical protein